MTFSIPLARPILGAAEEEGVIRVLRSGHLSQGQEVASFEEEFRPLVDGRSCVAVSSGTAALHVLLLAHGIGAGDEVLVPSFTFAATANAVRLAGAHPVFVDIDPETFCIDPVAAGAAITSRTAAVVAVHLYGHPADMRALAEIAGRAGVLLLEDAAQAHGASVDGTPVGALGDGAAFSFYPTKNMTTGEGGMVVVDEPQVERRARLLRNQGMAGQYEHEIVGFNLRLTDLQAAIGRAQLRRLDGATAVRRRHATIYDGALRGVTVPSIRPRATHVYHQYTVRASDRDALQRHLATCGVESRAYYEVPVHRLAPYESAPFGPLPETERAAREVLSLPVAPNVSDQDIEDVVEAINRWSTQ